MEKRIIIRSDQDFSTDEILGCLEDCDSSTHWEVISDEENGFFQIPSMVVHRDDIISQYEGRDDFEEIKKEVESLSDNQMKEIADRMTGMLMEQFNIAVKIAYEEVE
jgi:ribosomal protein S17E